MSVNWICEKFSVSSSDCRECELFLPLKTWSKAVFCDQQVLLLAGCLEGKSVKYASLQSYAEEAVKDVKLMRE